MLSEINFGLDFELLLPFLSHMLPKAKLVIGSLPFNLKASFKKNICFYKRGWGEEVAKICRQAFFVTGKNVKPF